MNDRSGRALGFPESDLPSSIVNDTVEITARLHRSPESTHRPSMLLDSESGRPIEVENIFGEVVRMARQHNVDMPVSCFYLVTWTQLITLCTTAN